MRQVRSAYSRTPALVSGCRRPKSLWETKRPLLGFFCTPTKHMLCKACKCIHSTVYYFVLCIFAVSEIPDIDEIV